VPEKRVGVLAQVNGDPPGADAIGRFVVADPQPGLFERLERQFQRIGVCVTSVPIGFACVPSVPRR
jgi:hypothetical protein